MSAYHTRMMLKQTEACHIAIILGEAERAGALARLACVWLREGLGQTGRRQDTEEVRRNHRVGLAAETVSRLDRTGLDMFLDFLGGRAAVDLMDCMDARRGLIESQRRPRTLQREAL